MLNLVEMLAPQDECKYNQPCAFGHLVEGHAVYCHNDRWPEHPRKCRRSWYTQGFPKREKVRDEDCEGFMMNPLYSPNEKSGGNGTL